MPGSRQRLGVALMLLLALAASLTVILISFPRAAPPAHSTPAPGEVALAAPASSPREGSAGARQAPAAPPEKPRIRGRLAIVIDDVGYDLAELEPFLELPLRLSVAVLPNLPASQEAARRVLASGKELLLHLPMEPEGGENPGPGAILTGMPPAEVERLLAQALAAVPGAAGVNNHMGSLATGDEELMRTLLAAIRRRGLYWLDSRTTAATVGRTVARELGVPAVERGVFLDATEGEGAIERAIAKAVSEALRDGAAVAIGHVQTPGLVDILSGAVREMGAAEVSSVEVGELVRSVGREDVGR